MSTRWARRFVAAVLAIGLMALGAATTEAGLIGSSVDLSVHFPDRETVFAAGGTKIVGDGVEYPALLNFDGGALRIDVDVTDTQLIITNAGEDAHFDATFGPFNGFVLTIVSGPALLSATWNAALSDPLFRPFEISVTPAQLVLNFVDEDSTPRFGAGMPAGTSSVIDIAAVPEPATLTLVGSGVAALVARRMKRARRH